MARIRTMVEVSYTNDEGQEEKANYWLLHWGLQFSLVPDSNGNTVPVQYTVAICEKVKGGAVELFFPSQLTILGSNIKNDK